MHRPALRRLGKTGLEVSELTLGTWGLCAEAYGMVLPEQRAQTVKSALDAGISTFDMAPAWGPDALSERTVQAAVGNRRDEVVYITRAGQRLGPDGPEATFSPEALRRDCEESLRRLDTDHLDVWLLHNPSDAELRRDEAVGTAEALAVEGKVRAWGAAVAHVDQARAALSAGAQVLCLPYNLMRPRLWWDIEQECVARGVGVLAHSVLLHGLLSGRYGPKKRFAPDDHRARRWSPEALEERVKTVGKRRPLVHPPSLTLSAFSLRFALAHPEFASAVIGPRRPDQVEAACRALEPTGTYLTPDELTRIRSQLD